MKRRKARGSGTKIHAPARRFFSTACPKGKVGFVTRADAKAAAERMRKKGNGRMRPYRCTEEGCDAWHVGHLPPVVIDGRMTAAEVYRPERNAT